MRHTHILFDFFGTLVDYSASRTEQGYARTHALVRQLGGDLTYPEFLSAWTITSEEFDLLSDADDHEFSMADVGTAFLATVLGRRPSPAEVAAVVDAYVNEWNTGVTYPPGVAGLVRDLAVDYRLAVVTNTHQPDLVPNHLDAMGLLPHFDAVITSVEVGWRKPHPTIYATALRVLGVDAQAAVFVGDTYGPDFLGPERAGMAAFLIDPGQHATIPATRRLTSVLDLPAGLRTLSGH